MRRETGRMLGAVCAGLAAFMAGMAAHAQTYGLWEELFGAARCTFVLGNGRLTIGLNATGGIAACRWPGPTHPNHVGPNRIDPKTGNGFEGGTAWGVRRNGEIYWLTPQRGALAYSQRRSAHAAPVVETLTELDDGQLAVVQTAFVHPDRDLLVSRVTIPHESPPLGFAWFADFSPCTRALPELALLEPALAERNDFAAFRDAERNTVYVFRPKGPSSLDWEDAARWAKKPEADLPRNLRRPGVWIGYTGASAFERVYCGPDAAKGLATAASGAAHVGPGETAAALPAEPLVQGCAAAIYAAFGESREAVDDTLAFAKGRGYDALLEDTISHWNRRLANAARRGGPPASEPLLRSLCTQALANVLVNCDAASGAIARAPVSSPPLGIDVVRHGVWMTLALDMANFPEIAERHLRFYLEHVRGQRDVQVRGMPSAAAGSLPAALYADGEDALPHPILDVEATAKLVWAVWQHAAFLDGEQRLAFLNDAWEPVERATGFLADWFDVNAGRPIVAFDPGRAHDAQSLELIASGYLGIKSALAIGNVLGHDRPLWAARRAELESYLTGRLLDIKQQWKIGNPVAFWAADIVGAGDPRWERPVRDALASIDKAPPFEAMRVLCDATMLLRDQPDQLAPVKGLLAPTVQRLLTECPPDAYYSALAVIAILATFPDGQG